MFSKLVTVAAIAGLAAAQGEFNAGDGLVTTVSTTSTSTIIVTSCAPTVTDCPANGMTTALTTYEVVQTLTYTSPIGATTANPVAPVTVIPTTIAAVIVPSGATGTGGAVAPTNTATYNMPSPSGSGNNGGNGGYNGPSFTGAANKMSAAGAAVVALAGAAAALI